MVVLSSHPTGNPPLAGTWTSCYLVVTGLTDTFVSVFDLGLFDLVVVFDVVYSSCARDARARGFDLFLFSRLALFTV